MILTLLSTCLSIQKISELRAIDLHFITVTILKCLHVHMSFWTTPHFQGHYETNTTLTYKYISSVSRCVLNIG